MMSLKKFLYKKSINLGYKINYMDESDISLKNNNFLCWRKSNEFIFHDYTSNNRFNNSSSNEKAFLEFMDGFLKNGKNDLNNKFILVLHNLACHKTSKVKNFFLKIRLILFIILLI